ncbi:hypothetical protein [Solitalea lacus]|uniref:hypothetical protein n=1 Tax=Solitalea lacus TaxID=2911172 RepID=UPI001EDC84F4|nr:hypothetical protein [Solitalea lacus]UKJ08042.1 hypothetical protein L2B55_02470 [Solitalea lacus]
MPEKKRKTLYWLAGIIVFILLTMGSIVIFYAYHYEHILKTKLQKEVFEKSKGLYRLEMDRVIIRPFIGKIKINQPRLLPDTNRYNQLKELSLAPPSLYTASCKTIQLSNVNLWDYFKYKKLSIRLLLIEQPKLVLVKDLNIQLTKTTKPIENLYQMIASLFKATQLRAIKIIDGDFTYNRKTQNKTTSIHINKFTIEADDFLVDSVSEMDTTRFFYCKNIQVQVADYNYLTPNNRYSFSIGQFNLSTSDSSITLVNVNLTPRFKKEVFAQKAGEQTDCFTLTTDSVYLKGVQLRTLLFDERIRVKNIEIIKPQFESYRDKNVKRKNFKEKLLFHQMLQQLPHEVLIANLKIKNGYINYEEVPEKGKQAGAIYFTNLYADFTNINNIISTSIPKNININAQAFLMGSGDLHVKFILPVNPSEKTFKVNGSLKAMDIDRMNTALEKLAYIRVRTGRVNQLNFDITATPDVSKTHLKFLYSNLELQLLNKQTGTTERQGLASTLVNALIIDESNPIAGLPPRIINVSYHRDKTRSVFNFLWKSLFMAIKPAVGVTAKKEIKIADLKTKFEAYKNKSKRKREARKLQQELEKQSNRK